MFPGAYLPFLRTVIEENPGMVQPPQRQINLVLWLSTGFSSLPKLSASLLHPLSSILAARFLAQSGVTIRPRLPPRVASLFGEGARFLNLTRRNRALLSREDTTGDSVKGSAAPQWQRVWTELNETHSWAKRPLSYFLSPFHFCLCIYARTHVPSAHKLFSPLVSLGFSIRGYFGSRW